MFSKRCEPPEIFPWRLFSLGDSAHLCGT